MPGTGRGAAGRRFAGSHGALSLLCVATLIPRKGHALLIEALAGLQDRDWTLHCVGSTTRDAVTAGSVRAAIRRPRPGRTRASARRGRCCCLAGLLRPRRCLRAALAARRLRHGAGRSAGPRPAGGQQHGRRDRRHRAVPRPACWCRRATASPCAGRWRVCSTSRPCAPAWRPVRAPRGSSCRAGRRRWIALRACCGPRHEPAARWRGCRPASAPSG